MPGTEVLALHGVPASVVLERLLPLTRADGSNDAKRIDQLSVTGDSIYEAFDVYYPLVFPQTRAIFRLTIRAPSNRQQQFLDVRPQTHAKRIAAIIERERDRRGGDQPKFDWKYLGNSAAYLKMPSWALYQSSWDWRTWLESHLNELATREVPAFIVDIRGNEGGEDVGDVIISRLIKSELDAVNGIRLVRYRSVPQDLRAYLDTWDQSFFDWGTDASELRSPWPTAPPVHFLTLASDQPGTSGRPLNPKSPHYGGRVFVLVDSANSSATFQFAEIIQREHLGTLIGQPTGGNLRGINGGAFFFLRLPHSKIEMDVPLIGTFPSRKQPDRGLVPDIETHLTAQDILADVDPELAAVDALLRSRL